LIELTFQVAIRTTGTVATAPFRGGALASCLLMAVRLHRCSNDWVRCEGHPCWRVQQALEDAGVPYEVVSHPAFPRTDRTEYTALTGERTLPAIELPDGTIVHRESRELVRMIADGEIRG
jgi:hypothetical protein